MHAGRQFLREERGARGRGIPRGSVGAEHDTAICGGDTRGAHVPVRAATDRERAALSEGGFQGRDESRAMWLVGSAQRDMCEIRRRLVGEDFARWQGETRERFDVQRPAGVRAGPSPKRIQRAVAAEERRVERAAEQVRQTARAGLDLSDPRQRARAKAREERAAARAAESPLNRYQREQRELGRTGTV